MCRSFEATSKLLIVAYVSLPKGGDSMTTRVDNHLIPTVWRNAIDRLCLVRIAPRLPLIDIADFLDALDLALVSSADMWTHLPLNDLYPPGQSSFLTFLLPLMTILITSSIDVASSLSASTSISCDLVMVSAVME